MAKFRFLRHINHKSRNMQAAAVLLMISVCVCILVFIYAYDLRTRFDIALRVVFQGKGKSEKLNALLDPPSQSSENDFDSVPEATTSKLVVTIPEDLQLTDPERSVLSKGLSYVPVKPRTDEYDTKADCERFYRRLRLTAHFNNNPSEPGSGNSQPVSVDESEDKSFESLKPKTSSWTPPPGSINFKERLNRKNLTTEEIAALASLRRRDDIVIKPADKDGAVVVWARQLYVQEAERHLSDANFYRQLSHDHTNENNERVQVVVKDAIQSGELPASASYLIIDQPLTSKFYLLPKIHKPGNPGRPIVSACNCPTELIATYLDRITTPLVHNLPSFVKDTNHMLQIAESFRFPELTNYVFTMDVKSLYTVIPNQDGLLALEHFLDKRSVLQPPTHTLLRLAELVLTLNTFTFNGNYYEQEQIFEQYPGRTPDLFKRYIDDIMGAASCSKREIEDFASFVNNFHPNLTFTWSISEEAVSFLDLCIKPSGHRLTTTIHYKETDTHSYLNYFSSHPVRCKKSIPFSQLLRLKRICSEADDFNERSKEMFSYFLDRKYPPHVVNHALNQIASSLERISYKRHQHKEHLSNQQSRLYSRTTPRMHESRKS
ncbi:hypothetical protein ACROYT_G034153 [Oculina patagonica]